MAAGSAEQGWASSAALQALLRYKPQREGLAQLQQAAEERFQGSVSAGQTEGVLGKQAAAQAKPEIAGIYDKAASEAQRARGLGAGALASLAPGSPFAAAAANEQSAAGERLAGSRATAQNDVSQRALAASELPAYTQRAASATLLKELQQLMGKANMLNSSEGADTQTGIEKQRQEAAKSALTERGQNLTHSAAEAGHATSEHNSERTAASKAAAGTSSKPLTTAQQKGINAASSTIAQIRQVVGKHGEGLTRAQLVQKLSEGHPQESFKEGTESFKTAAIPAYKPDARMAAALDWHEYGHMTRNTEARLQREGVDPARVGVPRAPAPPKTANQFGQRVSKALSGF
jgi:hypothetical protein